jgi:hypothetical protein
MKTSNYILAAFAVLVLISIFVLARCAKEHEITTQDRKGIEYAYPTGAFNALVVKTSGYSQPMEIRRTDDGKYKTNTLSLSVFDKRHANLYQKLYRISNDTLFLTFPPESSRDLGWPTILYCENISSINIDHVNISIKDNFSFDSLYVNIKFGSIYSESKTLRLNKLTIDAEQSNINLHLRKTKIDNLNLRLFGDSHFNLSQKGYSDKVSIDKDSSSRYQLRDIR